MAKDYYSREIVLVQGHCAIIIVVGNSIGTDFTRVRRKLENFNGSWSLLRIRKRTNIEELRKVFSTHYICYGRDLNIVVL